MDRILIVGGTGMLGRPVARRLASEGFAVRVFTRNAEEARGVLGEDFEYAEGDVRQEADVRRAMGGCAGVHVNLSGEIEAKGTQVVARAARESGIQRLTYVSGASVRPENAWFPQTKRKLLAEAAIRESGIAYTIFRPTWFMESLALFVRGGRAFLFGRQRRPFRFVAADDFARMVAAAYRTQSAADRVFYVYGPEPLYFHDALRRYCQACHPEIKRITTIPYWLARFLSHLGGRREMREAAALMAFLERVGESESSEETDRLLGRPETTFETWLAKMCGEQGSVARPSE